MKYLQSLFEFFWELAKVAAVALVLAGLVRYFVFQPFFVEGVSMEPNFENGEYLIVDEMSYYFKHPARGEVVVFNYPLDTSKYYIKRVIGLPGETVEIKDGKIVIYNNEFPEGAAISENYLPSGLFTDGNIKKKLGMGEYFVLGDNRHASSDSRRWGVLPSGDIVGRVLIRAWPLDKINIFKSPTYAR